MSKGKKTYASWDETPSEFVAQQFGRLGLDVDSQRLEDRVLADKENRQAKERAHVDRVKILAGSVKRARRACEVAETCWRIEPTRENLQDAMDAQRARSAAEAALLEACQNDRGLMSQVLYQLRD